MELELRRQRAIVERDLNHKFKQCFLNFSVPKNYLESMLKHRFLGSVPRDADFIDEAEELAFPSNSQVRLSHAAPSTEPEEPAPVSGTLFTT